MKYIVYIVIVATLIAGLEALPTASKESIRAMYGKCITDSQISLEDAADVIVNMNIRDEPEMKNFYFCINKQNGVQDENGTFLKDAVYRRMNSPHFSQRELSQIVNVCTEKKETGPETAYQFLRCMRKTFIGYR